MGQKLKVKTVLEGSVRKAGNRLRVNAQLNNAEDGYHLWSERYDREMDDVFAVQDEIARSVVERLKVQLLDSGNTPIISRPTDDLPAYELVLKGRHHLVRLTGPSLERSLECFSEAVEIAPSYAQAHAGVATVQAYRVALQFASAELMASVKTAARKALAIDGAVAEAHAAMAIALHFERDWPGAEREYQRALRLNPGDEFARCSHMMLLSQVGRTDAGIIEGRQGVDLNPISVVLRHYLADGLYIARQYEAAVDEANAGLELEPNYYHFYWDLGWSWAGLGDYEEAVAALRRGASRSSNDPLTYAFLGWALGLAGRREEAKEVLRDLEQRREEGSFSGFLLALVHLGLEDREKAVSALQRAEEERDVLIPFINVWPALDPLRSDPRFRDLVRRMNFPQP